MERRHRVARESRALGRRKMQLGSSSCTTKRNLDRVRSGAEPAEPDPSRVVYPLEGRRKLDCCCCCWRWHRTVVAGGTARTTWATFFGALDGPLVVSVRRAARLDGHSLVRRAAYVGRLTPRPRARLLPTRSA